MAGLTDEMKEMILNHQCFHATVSKDGVPNNAPKRSTRILNDQTLLFNEGTGGQTYRNILDGSKISTAVVNRDIPDGFRFVGRPEAITEGEIYDQAAAMSKAAGMPQPVAVILIHIEEIHTLKPGPMAGKRIA